MYCEVLFGNLFERAVIVFYLDLLCSVITKGTSDSFSWPSISFIFRYYVLIMVQLNIPSSTSTVRLFDEVSTSLLEARAYRYILICKPILPFHKSKIIGTINPVLIMPIIYRRYRFLIFEFYPILQYPKLHGIKLVSFTFNLAIAIPILIQRSELVILISQLTLLGTGWGNAISIGI